MNTISAAQAQIMMVDDEHEILLGLETLLTAAGYGCHPASQPEEAVKLARRIEPDLLICDINLDGESGLELCQEIKSQPPLDQIPVIFLSGAQIPDVIRRAHAVGGTYYLRKPFDPTVILELIDKALWMPHLVAAHAGK